MKLFVITLLVSFSLTFSLNTNDLCRLVEKDCAGQYFDSSSRYKIVCQHVKCAMPFQFQCDSTTCSQNITACEQYSEMDHIFNSKLYKSLSIHSFFSQSSIDSRKKFLNEFGWFKKSIKNCTKSQFVWENSSVCVNVKKQCLTKLTQTLFLFEPNYFRKPHFTTVKCPCSKKHSFECGSHYCAVSMKDCDFFKANKKLAVGLKNCY